MKHYRKSLSLLQRLDRYWKEICQLVVCHKAAGVVKHGSLHSHIKTDSINLERYGIITFYFSSKLLIFSVFNCTITYSSERPFVMLVTPLQQNRNLFRLGFDFMPLYGSVVYSFERRHIFNVSFIIFSSYLVCLQLLQCFKEDKQKYQ